MATLSLKSLGLDEGSSAALELRGSLGPEPWSLAQLAGVLTSLNCLIVPEPGPDSPASPLLGLAAAFRSSDIDDADGGLLGSLDDLVLQARLRFRMDRPQSSEDGLVVVEFLLLLVQELGSRLQRERRAHAEALQQSRQDAEARAQRRQFLQQAEAPEAPDAGAQSPSRGRERGRDEISAIRKAQEERRAALAEAVARMQREMEETRAREKQLFQENENLIRSTAQCEQAIDEYRTEGAILSEHAEGLYVENVDLRLSATGLTPRAGVGRSSLASLALANLRATRDRGGLAAGGCRPSTPRCGGPADRCQGPPRRAVTRLFSGGRKNPRGPYIATMRQCLDELSGGDSPQAK